MTSIVINTPATLAVTVKSNGAVTPITGGVQASITSMTGVVLVPAFSVTGGSNGVVTVPLTADQTAAVPAGDAILVLTGAFGVRRFPVLSEDASKPTRSALFFRDLVIEKMRNDRLTMLAASLLPDLVVTDDYIWDKILAAESFVSHTLRVALQPTHYFPAQPTQTQIDVLGDMPWDIDPRLRLLA